ncbi:hypothetical protein [Halomarina pelagica]|uniref:hypothetical protein n=1 Tax=Halomarina pelagica TaxID=2961599 RepID=UPI0020C3D47B|nr:hypothetical protein [Halomarina sp. BND7]
MTRRSGAIVALAAVLVLAAVAAGASLTANGPNAGAADPSLAPGQQFAGVVGVQDAEVDGALAARALEARLADAPDDRARAAIVASAVAEIDAALTSLERQRTSFRAARANGTLPPGAYRARLARIAAVATVLDRRAATLEGAIASLPRGALDGANVTADDVASLRARADALLDAEVRSAARAVAGDDVGAPFVPTEPEDGAVDGVGDGDPASDDGGGGSDGERRDGTDGGGDGGDDAGLTDGGDGSTGGTDGDGDDSDDGTGAGGTDGSDGTDSDDGGDADGAAGGTDGDADGPNDGDTSGGTDGDGAVGSGDAESGDGE